MSADGNLDALLERADVWRGNHFPPSVGIPTGFAALDDKLPGGGWPVGALTEILVPALGIGELRLVMPALARLSHKKRWMAWIAPPHIPYAPALTACGIDLSRTLIVRPRAHSTVVPGPLRTGTRKAPKLARGLPMLTPPWAWLGVTLFAHGPFLPCPTSKSTT